MAESRLAQLTARGQSVWIDLLSRELVHSGELAKLRDHYSVTGLTSNPSIFQKAIAGGGDYDDQIRELLNETDDPRDRRFADPEWSSNQFFDFVKQAYLLSSNWADHLVADVQNQRPLGRHRVALEERALAVFALGPLTLADGQ